ncbi:hypothetical protein [Paenibacillus sp. PK3_47]|uniref:hypothetical protein n=1 Tax=Paenibacillus sp. PK3_47 TaxID=2072642 RepID=UPI00201D9152|nr:hypothetical protein [Paenibacillus sp. PK3_47]
MLTSAVLLLGRTRPLGQHARMLPLAVLEYWSAGVLECRIPKQPASERIRF